jgi:hypothetical protein
MVQGKRFLRLIAFHPANPHPIPLSLRDIPLPVPAGGILLRKSDFIWGHTCLFYVTVMNKQHKIHDFQGGVFLKKQRYFTVSPFYFLLQQEAIAICVEIC